MVILKRFVDFKYVSRRAGKGMLFVSLALLLATNSFAKRRVTLEDITLPQPKKGQSERLDDIRVRKRNISPRTFSSAEFTFYINKKGAVDSIGWSHNIADSLVFRPYEDSLLATTFDPGKIRGKKSAFELVAKLFVLGNEFGARGIVDFPVNSGGELLDYSLALKSMERHAYQAPALDSFPSYFYRKPDAENDRESMYEFAIVRVSLDSNGAPGEREVFYATDKDLGEMIQTATGWADYSPARVEGRAVASEGFVFVRFFREIPYPVGTWRGAGEGSASGLESLRVAWIPGMQFRDVAPVQRGNKLLQLRMVMAFSLGVEKNAQLRVDGRGRATITNLSGVNGKVDRGLANDKLKLIPFYPAFRLVDDSTTEGLALKPLDVLGRLRLLPLDSTTYQVETEFIDRFNTLYRSAPSEH